MADRQGNPVPPGTKVNFVSETGVLQPAFCVIPDVTPPQSSCTVEFRSQGTRTANGAVSILAYAEGDEDFVDNNGNNIYDAKEPFTDLGLATRDDNGKVITGADGVYNAGEFQIPRANVPACVNASGCTGDGVWGAADVRAQTTLVQASGDALIRLPKGSVASRSGFSAIVSNYNSNLVGDLNNFSVPTGSAIEVKVTAIVTDAKTTCKLNSLSTMKVPNSTWSLTLPVTLSGCSPTDVVSIKVTTPLGTVSQTDFELP
jgi:archaellin